MEEAAPAWVRDSLRPVRGKALRQEGHGVSLLTARKTGPGSPTHQDCILGEKGTDSPRASGMGSTPLAPRFSSCSTE